MRTFLEPCIVLALRNGIVVRFQAYPWRRERTFVQMEGQLVGLMGRRGATGKSSKFRCGRSAEASSGKLRLQPLTFILAFTCSLTLHLTMLQHRESILSSWEAISQYLYNTNLYCESDSPPSLSKRRSRSLTPCFFLQLLAFWLGEITTEVDLSLFKTSVLYLLLQPLLSSVAFVCTWTCTETCVENG